MKMSELNDNKKYTEVNFMIFRTGNALIVGNFSEKVLRFVFEFIKKILNTEYSEISIVNDNPKKKKKEIRIRNWSVNISV
jgi:predicted site-specific integrase-resolvase